MAERERAKLFAGRRRRGRASSSQQRETLGTESSTQGRAGHLWPHPDVSAFIGCVQLAQFFVGRRLDEPEAGNDAPAQGAGHEDTQRRQEPAGENRDDSDQPDECQGEIEDGVVDADDEVFHGAYSLRDVEKIPLSGGSGRMLSQCLQRSTKEKRTNVLRIYLFTFSIPKASRDYCIELRLSCRTFLHLYGSNSFFEKVLLFKLESKVLAVQVVEL